MPHLASLLVPLALGATVQVPAGADLSAALASARPGDVIRLGPGQHRASLGRRSGPLRIEGAGPEATEVVAPEGEDGLVVVEGGEVSLSGLALRAGRARSALKVLGGAVRCREVLLQGGTTGAFVEGGRLEGQEVTLGGDWGLLARGQVQLTGGAASGLRAGVALLSGSLTLTRFAVTGPSAEAGVSVSGPSRARLVDVVIRSPGASGLAVTSGASVEAVALEVAGAQEQGGFLGDCVQVRRATVKLQGGTLSRCAGAALEASRAAVDLRGVGAAGGDAGCLALIDGTTARLDGNRCTGRGPAVVIAGGSKASARMSRWQVDPVYWVECGSGARVKLGDGERVSEPCRGAADPLDRSPRP
ncbi:MAG: hypothetical protein QM767_03030 [Anaeromyxobacter sp.]